MSRFRWWSAAAILTLPLLGASVHAQCSAGSHCTSATVPNDSKPSHKATSEFGAKLYRPISIDFHEFPLNVAIDDLREMTGLAIIFDKPALEEMDVKSDHPVTVKGECVSVESALKRLLRPMHLTFVLKDEMVVITSHARAKQDKCYRVQSCVQRTAAIDPAPECTNSACETAPMPRLQGCYPDDAEEKCESGCNTDKCIEKSAGDTKCCCPAGTKCASGCTPEDCCCKDKKKASKCDGCKCATDKGCCKSASGRGAVKKSPCPVHLGCVIGAGGGAVVGSTIDRPCVGACVGAVSGGLLGNCCKGGTCGPLTCPLTGMTPPWVPSIPVSMRPFFDMPPCPFAPPVPPMPCAMPAPAPAGDWKLSKGKHGIKIETPHLEGTCDSMTMSADDGFVTLEGHVVLKIHTNGASAEIKGDRITVCPSDLSFKIEGPVSPPPVSPVGYWMQTR